MNTPGRLPPQPGEWIDRARALRFRFEGREYGGFAGDTLSSALHAHGVRMLGRSFKYHRPRGIYSLANHDVNALVADGCETNIRADVTALRDGAQYTAVNTFGGLQWDWARITDWFGRFLPVGFYYKTFHRPRFLFPFWERRMRELAGLGAVNSKAKRLRTPKRYDFCDVLVVGAGPAGLAAAVAAAGLGLRVVVVDEQPRPGGSLNYQGDVVSSAPKREQLLKSAAALPSLELRGATLAAGLYPDHWVALVDERRMTKMRARSVILATGCFEQPALFGNNDLPGVMLASAAQRLIRLYAVRPFERAVVLAANSDGYRAALDLQQAGVEVAAVVDPRPEGERSPLGEQAAAAGLNVRKGCAVCEALPGPGKASIRGARITASKGGARDAACSDLACDGIAMSVGWAPADGLLCQVGGKMRFAEALQQFVPERMPEGLFTAGRLNGVYPLADQCADGERAGLAAAAHLGAFSGSIPPSPSHRGPPPSHPLPYFTPTQGKVFVDLDEDVQVKDLEHAAQEGFDNIELLKRYSTFGMGPSQGKHANTNTIRLLAKLKGQSVGETGAPRARPFFHPVAFSHLAGRGFHPHRQTPLHGRHARAGAVFMPAGEWFRPAYYEEAGKSREAAITDEVLAVRRGVGVIDVGTLGKLEISGPDAAEFLERHYTGRFANMRPGTTRYGLMCDETGVIVDDGVVGRLAAERYYVTTTTTASGSVYREMQRWAILWGLKVVLVNATGTYAGMNVAGPSSRRVLSALTDINLAEEAFPYLGLREGTVAGAPARVMRVGFVGELGYEVHVPASQATRVWDALLEAGAAEGVRPFGVEAQRLLRLEKGHVIIGQDTDGLTTPFEAGMEWAVKMEKSFFIGQRSLAILRPKPRTRALAGFTLPKDWSAPCPKECHLVIQAGQITGRVTSVAYSPTQGQVLGLAYLLPAQAQPGKTIEIRVDGGELVRATVAKIPFYDPDHQRQKLQEQA